MLRFLLEVVCRVLRVFLPCLCLCEGLWLGSVLPGQAVNLMVLSVIGTIGTQALSFGIGSGQPAPIRLAALVTTILLAVPMLAMYLHDMPAFQAAGGWVMALILLNIVIVLGCVAVAVCATLDALSSLKDVRSYSVP